MKFIFCSSVNVNDVPTKTIMKYLPQMLSTVQNYIRVQKDHVIIMKLFPISGNGVFI